MAQHIQAEKGSEKTPPQHHNNQPSLSGRTQGPLATLQKLADDSIAVQRMSELQNMANARYAPVQRRESSHPPNGLPQNLKSGIENLSGISMADVTVQRNSSEPAKVGAHAFAQGTNIHLGPGQDKHLPHEAWHVVQQKQGRVKPTMQMKGGAINDDVGLEREADVMGAKALQNTSALQRVTTPYGAAELKTDNTLSTWVATQPLALPESLTGSGLQAMQMATSDYPKWTQALQRQSTTHGHCTVGGMTVVTQFRASSQVLQMQGWSSTKTVNASLQIAEGLATMAAGIAAAVIFGPTLFGGVGPGPAILGAVAGALKFVRGLILLFSYETGEGGEKDRSKTPGVGLAFIDVLRVIEAGLITGAAAWANHIPLIVFGALKSFRSLLAALLDFKGPDWEGAYAIGILSGVIHGLEVISVGVAGGLQISGADGAVETIAGGVALAGTAGSKGVRVGTHAVDTHRSHKKSLTGEKQALVN